MVVWQNSPSTATPITAENLAAAFAEPVDDARLPVTAQAATLAATYATPGVPANVLALTRAPNLNVNAATVLKPWFAALANRDNKRANIVVLGDSITEGYGASAFTRRWVSELAAGLRRRYGVTGGGRGYIGAMQTGSASFTWPCTLSSGVTAGSVDYGLKRDVRAMNSGTATFALNGTSADIMYPQFSGATTMNWAVDGGATTVIDENVSPSTDGILTRVPLGTSGAHSLVVTGIGTGSYLDGVIEYNGDETSGIQVHDGGHAGYRSDQWNAGGQDLVANWPAAYSAIGADLIILSLGVNDAAQGNTAASFQTAMTTLMAKVRTFAPLVPIVLMTYGAVQYQLATWPAFVTAMYALATADGNALVADLSLRLTNHDDANTYSTWYDSNHPTDKGHSMIADLMTNFLSPS